MSVVLATIAVLVTLLVIGVTLVHLEDSMRDIAQRLLEIQILVARDMRHRGVPDHVQRKGPDA